MYEPRERRNPSDNLKSNRDEDRSVQSSMGSRKCSYKAIKSCRVSLLAAAL